MIADELHGRRKIAYAAPRRFVRPGPARRADEAAVIVLPVDTSIRALHDRAMPSLERFKISPSPFVSYYGRFLQNSFRQRRYRIVLRDGDQVEGVPTTAAISDPRDPDVSFNLETDSGFYRIPFTELVSAEEL